MARIRTIKPEFFTSEDIVGLTPLSRLFYVSLWCESDREGRLEWKPRTFKLRYFPGDECDIEKMGTELIDAGLIVLYENGKYAEIPAFSKHQVINNRENESSLPPRVKDASSTRESGRKEGRKGTEGKEGNAGTGVPCAVAPRDPVKDEIWKHGRQMLVEGSKMTTEKAGEILGKLVKDLGPQATLDGIRHCIRASIADPKTYLLSLKRGVGKQAELERHNDEVLREALGATNG